MLKNNIFAMLTQILCIISSYIFSFIFWNFLPGAVIISILILVIYVFIGTRLKLQGSKLKNLLSVSSVGIVGIFLWVFIHGTDLISKYFKGLFVLYLHPLGVITLTIPNYIRAFMRNDLVQICFSILPTFLIWAGLEWKARRNRVRPV